MNWKKEEDALDVISDWQTMDRKTSVSGNDNSRDGSNCFLLAQPDGGVLPRLR